MPIYRHCGRIFQKVSPFPGFISFFFSVMRIVYSLKGIKSIAQRQATWGAAPWVSDEGNCAL